jgi:hypothetical protein
MVAIVLSAMVISTILGLLENGGFTKKTVAALAICLCLLFAVSGAYVYFDRVSILECNHHLDHTQLASFVARNIETSFVYVYAPFDDYREEVEAFVELIASRQIADIRGRGASEADYFQVLTPQGLSDAVDFIRAGDRAVSVVAHDSAEWQAEASGGLASAMEIDNCKAVRMGSLTIWSCSGTGDQQPGSGDQDSAREGE